MAKKKNGQEMPEERNNESRQQPANNGEAESKAPDQKMGGWDAIAPGNHRTQEFARGGATEMAMIYDMANAPAAGAGADSVAGASVIRYRQPVGPEQVREAANILMRYRQGKANLEHRIVENEQWWKLRHWECMRTKDKELTPTSAWLFNVLANKHADAMDNYPEPNILPREEGDKMEAKLLSQIIPVVIQQNDFMRTYSDAWWYKLKHGCSAYGVFWNPSKLNGLGDIDIRQVDLINLFWEPGVKDIQESKHLFYVQLQDNDSLLAQYPQLENQLSTPSINVAKYIYDDSIDTSEKSAVVDWYYHKTGPDGRRVLHYCKFCNGMVLFATENDPETYKNGWYDHGKYPFEFDVLFPEEGTPAGFGYVDICKDPQTFIDMINAAILKNALVCAKPRYFIRADGSVNEEEMADTSKDFVHVNSAALGDDSIRPITHQNLAGIYVEILNSKITELKETSGNRDANTGGTTSGATAASAIAAMQEAGGKMTRDMIKTGYDCFSRIVTQCIELIRQFYNEARSFRIIGEQNAMEFVMYSNANIRPQHQGVDFGIDTGYRLPVFDVDVTASKASAYSKMSQNEMALQFYQLGFFNPQMADQSLACLDMMDFDRKDTVMQKIAENGTLFQQVQMLSAQLAQLSAFVDSKMGTNLGGALAGQMAGSNQPMPSGGGEKVELSAESKENATVSKAREQANEVSRPK